MNLFGWKPGRAEARPALARAGVILRDPYTNKPFVNFYATKRVGGCVTNSEAIKVMKFAAA